ncbi:MAG: phosphate--acyl-ACP acyltransferase, partial [Clostridia bacterium]|nr:phosphate--acyl-ACP acyltransferase [Clostridia bacterium]
MIKVVVDAHGGDNSPIVNVKGAIEAVKKIEDLQVILVGHEEKIKAVLKENAFESERLVVVHAPDEITCNDKPTEAIRHKTESSLYRAIEILKTEEGADALVSIGSTGALLAGAVLKIGRIK